MTRELLKNQVMLLCEKNKCTELARVRLSFSGGNGGLYDSPGSVQYIIECWPLDETVNRLNENGLVIGVHPSIRKSNDPFSNLKSANFLPYRLAARLAKQNQWNDCLVLNTHDRVADSTIANIFIRDGERVRTPPLSEGCVSGVMRRHLLENFHLLAPGHQLGESPLTTADVLSAEEVFLTNAIQGIRWVGQFGDRHFTNNLALEIHNNLARTILR
jgi:branched-chain amino acid aminotransferase